MLKNFFQLGKYSFIVCSVGFSLFTVARILLTFDLFDFHTVYYQSIQNLLHGHGLYNDPTNNVNYPPTTFLFLFPFGLLPLVVAEKLWTLISFSTLLLSIYILLKTLPKQISLKTYLLLYSFAMLSFPVKFTLGLGQVNLVILFLIGLTFFFYRKQRFFLAGILLGIAGAIKITPLLLVFFFLRKKQWQVVTLAILVFALSTLLAAFFFGGELIRQYYVAIFPHIPTVGNASYYNQALSGFLARVPLSNQVSVLVKYTVFILLFVVSLLRTRISKQSALQELLEYSLFITVTLIGAGLSWQHHFVLLIIPYTAVFLMLMEKTWQQVWTSLLILSFSYLLVTINIKNPQMFSGISVLLLSHVLYGTIILFILLQFQLVRKTYSALRAKASASRLPLRM